MSTDTPTLSPIRVTRGVAGQISATVDVTYNDDDTPETDTAVLVGSIYGGPVVLVMPSGTQAIVARSVTDRIGFEFHTDPQGWVRGFFGGRG